MFLVDIPSTYAAAKKRLPMLSMARWGDERSRKGSLKHRANLAAVRGCIGDYDGEKITPRKAARLLEKEGIEAVVYTSPSHSALKPRWRVVCPASGEFAVDEYQAWIGRVNRALGGVLEDCSFEAERGYFFGQVEGGAPVETYFAQGRPIDECDDIAPLYPDTLAEKSERDHGAVAKAPMGLTIKQAVAILEAAQIDWNDYHEWMEAMGAFRLEFDGSVEAFEAFCELAAQSDKFNRRENLRKWQRAFEDNKPNAKTLRSYNYQLPEDHPAKIDEHALSLEDARALFDEIDADTTHDDEPEAARKRLQFLSPSDCAALPARQYIWKGLLAAGDVACLYGAPGAGKSLLAPYLGFKVVQGSEAFGMRTKQGGVFYVAAEDETGMRMRVTALRNQLGEADDFHLVCGVSDLLKEDSRDLRELQRAVAEHKPRLIVIDTLAMAFPGLEENSAEGMGRVIHAARSLTKHGAAVVLIHHDTKANGGTPRGHSVLNGALDMAMRLEPPKREDETAVVRAKLTKNRNGPCDIDIAFKIGVETLGEDSDGDSITAAYCEPCDGCGAPRLPGLTSKEADIWHAIRDAGPSGMTREACRREYMRTRDDDKTEGAWERGWRRAVQGLIRKRRVIQKGARLFDANSHRELLDGFDKDEDDHELI